MSKYNLGAMTMKKKIVFLLMVTMIFISASCDKKASDSIIRMSGSELESILADKVEIKNYLIIDVREDDEYRAGHVPYAINISFQELEKRISEISDWKEKNVVVICRSGRRSRIAAETLVRLGFKKVFDADGVIKYNYKLEK